MSLRPAVDKHHLSHYKHQQLKGGLVQDLGSVVEGWLEDVNARV